MNKSAATIEQPLPTGDGIPIQDTLIEFILHRSAKLYLNKDITKEEFVRLNGLAQSIQERKLIGIERYGKPLSIFNGRSSLVDLVQEQMDAAVYTMQVIEETAEITRILLGVVYMLERLRKTIFPLTLPVPDQVLLNDIILTIQDVITKLESR